jgi:hypothetical protein
MAADVLAVLAQVGRGSALDEISREFQDVMESVRQSGGSGEVVIKLKVEGKSWHPNTNQLTEVGITHSVSSKRPKRKIGASTFFVTRHGDLTRNNPDQVEMFDETGELSERRTR